MLSKLRPHLIYTDISPDVVEHDDDVDAEEWNYNGRNVFRGAYDPRYFTENLHVFWLYDENLKRIGLAEHESSNMEQFVPLWFMDNAFATFYQNPEWKSRDLTVWNLLNEKSYLDCLDGNIYEECLKSGFLLVTPKSILTKPCYYECQDCGKSFKNRCSNAIKKFDLDGLSVLFVDDDLVLYDCPSGFTLTSVQPEPDACEAQQLEEQLTESATASAE